LNGVAVNVTAVPGQIVSPGFAATLTPAGIAEDTTIIMLFEVAGLFVAQEKSEVTWQFITSPFAGMFDQVGLFPPTDVPLRNHW
jgi:hypothetical protein